MKQLDKYLEIGIDNNVFVYDTDANGILTGALFIMLHHCMYTSFYDSVEEFYIPEGSLEDIDVFQSMFKIPIYQSYVLKRGSALSEYYKSKCSFPKECIAQSLVIAKGKSEIIIGGY